MSDVRLGIVTPVVTMLPGSHARWERDGTIEDVARIAEAADRLGYYHLTCSEHVALPKAEANIRGARYWDPLSTLGFLAARTTQIRLATFVLVLGYHHPLEIAKRYGTLDLVSGGRVVLGVGVGSLQAEFELLGASFEDRGVRADDSLRALRASLSSTTPRYQGEYVSFNGFVVDPCALQQRVPIWVGGRTLRSLRRAVALSDAWCPFAVSPSTAKKWVGEVDLPNGFDVVLSTPRALDPMQAPDAAEEALVTMVDAGATIVTAGVVHHSVEHCIEQLEALAAANARVNGASGTTP